MSGKRAGENRGASRMVGGVRKRNRRREGGRESVTTSSRAYRELINALLLAFHGLGLAAAAARTEEGRECHDRDAKIARHQFKPTLPVDRTAPVIRTSGLQETTVSYEIISAAQYAT